jgi:hypothetical protein
MNRLYSFVSALCLLLICAVTQPVLASNSPAYEQRRTNYIDTCLQYLGGDQSLPIEAYRGQALNTTALNSLLDHIRTDGDADFHIVQAVRVLFLTQATHTYDSAIMASLNSVKFWVNNRDSFHCYWSENHMCMWTSSDWLLHESYGRSVDTTLRHRLVQYLELKNKYGSISLTSHRTSRSKPSPHLPRTSSCLST